MTEHREEPPRGTDTLARRILDTADDGRARLARALHDGVQQQLVNVFVDLGRAHQLWRDDPDQAHQLVAQASEWTKNAIDDLRPLVATIYPSILRTHGLPAALDSLATRSTFPLEVDVAPDTAPEPLASSIYFLCADALDVVEPMDPTAVRVVVRAPVGDEVVVTIEMTVPAGPPAAEGSFGRVGDRIEALAGTMTLARSAQTLTLRAHLPAARSAPP